MRKNTVQSVNKERFAFMFASMVGRKVTVKLRNLTSYEGIFSGSSMDKGEYTVLLRIAHELASESRLSGPVHDQMIIQGKDIVMMNALDVPEEGVEGKEVEDRAAELFKTDVEINTRKGFSRGDRHLESWADLKDDSAQDAQLLLLESSKTTGGGWSGPQDQFVVAQKMGVVSTYSEELYTTPLDYSQLSSAQRARAEQIAKEIEGGRNYSSQEEGGDGEDEEAKFSAVIGTGGYKKSSHPSETASSWRKSGEAAASSNTRLNALNLEPATARSPAPAAAPVRPITPSPPAASEMKGINALNLEPASASRNAGWDPAASKYRAAGPAASNLTKRDFEIALAELNKNQQGKGKGKGSSSTRAENREKFSFNPNASTFTPGGPQTGNTLNIAITPGGSLSGTLKTANYDFYEQGPPPPMVMFPPPQHHGMMPMPMSMQPPMPMGPPPAFSALVEPSQMDKRSISEIVSKLTILDKKTHSSSSSCSFEWAVSSPEKKNSSYKDLLGPIPPGVTPMMPPMMPPPMMAPGYAMSYAPFYPGAPPGRGPRGQQFPPQQQQFGGYPPQQAAGGYHHHNRGGNYRHSSHQGGGSSQQSATPSE